MKGDRLMNTIKKIAIIMNKKTLVLFALILINYYSFSQCTNASSFGSAVAPTVTGTPTTISTCSYQTEYSTITAVTAGATYTINNSLGGCVTIHSGTPAGPIVAFGNVPFNFAPAAGGTYYFHWNVNCTGCVTATGCGTTTITLTSGGGPPPTPCTGGANNNCATADPFCTGTAYNYCNTTGVASLGQYNCLYSTPNPMWMYLNIATSGPIDIYIEQYTTGGIAIDVDFALWGPFTSSSVGCATIAPSTTIPATYPSGNLVDCSYSGAATETANIPNAVAGEWYMLLITNFNGSAGYIQFSQIGGSGTTNCNIVVPCASTAVGTNPLCVGGTGSILVTATGGTANYNVSWTGPSSGNPGGSEMTATGGTYNITGLVAGNYVITLTDATGCVTTQNVTITNPTPVVATQVHVNPPCFGGTTTATITGSGSTAPYNVSWTGTTSGNPAGTEIAASGGTYNMTGLGVGTYNVTVTSANGCTGTVTVTVTTPPVLTASDVETNVSCFGGTNGNGAITATGGTAPYNVSWTGTTSGNPAGTEIAASGGTYNMSGLAAGTYNVTVTDANGCTATTTVNILDGLVMTAGFTVNDNTQCLTGNSFAFTNTGSTGVYSWDFGDAGTSTLQNPSHTYAAAGTYTVTHTVTSGPCFATTTQTVTVYPMPLPVSTSTPVSCFGGSNGTATVTTPIGPGPGPFSYSWSPSAQTTNPASGLAAGSYTCTVTDQTTGCVGQTTVVVAQPTLLSASEVHVNPTCNGFTNGTATATGAGGTPNYTYSWNTIPIQNTQTAIGLAAGSYTCTVTDANGCQVTVVATLTQPAPIVLNPTMTPANCGLPDGATNVTIISGGVGPFTYSWNTVPVQTTASTANVPAGTYTVIVTDQANGCTQSASVTVTSTAGITANANFISDALCNGSNNGLAYAFPTGGAPIYTYSWNTIPVQTNDTLIAGAGTYTVVITDGSGCTGNASVTINEPTPVVASITGFTNATCFGANDGTATAGGAGGTSGYTYSWNTIPVQNTQNATGLAPGTYTVTVTDGNGCTNTAPVTIIDGPLMTSSVVGNDVTCFGGNDGSANLTVNGGTSPYNYNWTPSGSASEDPNGLTAGWHFVTVTSQEGCVVVDSVLINEPPLLVAVIDSSFDVSCFGYADGSAYASASGGTLTYSYSWNTVPIQTNPSVITFPFGLYTVTVTDGNGCQATATASINQPPALSATTGSVPAYCGVDQGSVWAFPTNGTAPYAYLWDSSAVIIGNNDTISGLYPGNYNLLLEDANGCKFNTTVIIVADPAGIASISTYTDALCFGSNDGTATVSVGGAFPGFTYQWDAFAGNQTNNPATGLGAGTYGVSVTDALGCVMNTTVTIGQPSALTLTLGSTSKICPNACDASIVSNPGGGIGPYTYSWNTTPTQIVQNAVNLCPGSYTLILTDNNGCTISDSATILNPLAMVMSHTITPANCNQSDGGATANVTANGTAPYTYTWDDGITVVGTGTTLANVFAGTYYVTAFDSLGCSITDTIIIPNLSGPTITIDSTFDVQCNGGNDGYAEVQVTGGSFPYSYSWNTVPVQNTPSASNLTAGSYTAMVADSNGCTASIVVNINEPTPLILNFGGVDPSCFNYTDGSAWVNVSGSVPPYSYSWNTVPIQTNDTVTGLSSGAYSATVTDANGCFNTVTVTLANPLLFSVNVAGNNVSCNNVCDGSATTALTNGIAPFTYLWDDPSTQTNDSVFGLCDGNVNVIVTDAMGCIASGGVIITEPAVLVVTENTHGNVSCANGNDGFSSVTVVGGTGPYNYNWDLSGSTVSTSQAANNLVAGSYLVIITDANGCTDQITVVIMEPNPINASVIPSPADCFGANTGSASSNVIGGTTPYTYQWDDPALQQTATASNLLAGTYSVTVTDSLGCTFVVNNIIINQPTQLVVNTTTVPSTCGTNNGSATVNVGGGTPNYSYNWNTIPAQSTLTANNIVAGNYVVVVTDANGCIDSTTANVTDLGGPTVTIPTFTNVSCNGATDGTAQSNVIGGTMPYTYSWNTLPVQTTPNATGLNAQTYSVTVTDSNGCVASASVIITQNLGLNASINASTNVSCFGLSNGQASVIVGGGGAPYTYSWNTAPIQTTSTATGLAAGTYIVTVSDINLCTASDTIIITQPALLTLSLDSLSNVKCNGGNTGYINVAVAGGTLGYSYLWAPNVSNGATAAGLVAGNYNVTVTDAQGCTASGNYDVFEPAQLVVSNVTVPSTCGQLNGSATISVVTNSTPNYTYSWNTNPVQTTSTAINLASSSYVVTVTDANGCIVTQNVTVTNIPGPIIDSIVTTPIACFGGNNGTAIVYATGTDPFTYHWSDPLGQSTQMAVGLLASPPIFTVVVTDANGCSTMGVTQITQPAQLTAMINSPDTICFGQPIQLFANASGGTPIYNFLWGGGQIGQGPLVEYPSTSTIYNVNVQDASGCTASATKMVIVRAQPQFTVADQTICQGEMATLTPANITGGNTNNPFNFFWMQIDSLSGTLSPTGVMNPINPLTVGPANTINYVVWVNDGCSSVDTLGVTVFVNDTATGQLVPVMDTCQGIVQYFALTTDVGISFGWDFNSDGVIDQTTTSTTTTYIYPSAGVFDVTVTLTTAQGCVSVISQPNWVTVHPNPIADFTTNPNPPEVTLINPTFNFIDQSFGADFWYWTFGDLTSDSINQNPSHTYQDTGYYNVTLLVTNNYGCTDMTTQTVRIRPDFFFAAPNTFTPNGDGVNDIFFPGTMLGASAKNYDFFIFDRWGEIIFEGHDLRDGWDGTYKGKIVQNGVYVWTIEVTDLENIVHNYIGHVNVLH